MREYEIEQTFREGFKKVIEEIMEKNGCSPDSLSGYAHNALEDAFMDLYDKYYK